MEEFESYFDTLNFHFTSWSDILENENIDIRSNNGELVEQNVQLLPRQDVSLYGIIPKMEKRSFSTCKDCKHVFNPKDVLLHKNCTVRIKSQHTPHFKKKVKSKKKSPVPLPPLFPTGLEGVPPLEELNTTEIRQNSILLVNVNELPQIDAAASPTPAKPSQLVEDVGNIPLPPIHNTHVSLNGPTTHDKQQISISQDQVSSKSTPSYTSSNFHTSSKCKRKKYSKSHRESDSKSHAGPTEDSKSQHMRSIKYSNHTSGNEALHRNKKNVNIDCNNYFTQDNPQEIPVPVVYMPMSPVSTISPIQIIKGEDLVCMDAPQVLTPTECPHQYYLTIPEQLTVKMYKTRPKLGSYPSYGARNIGGAIVFSKQKLVNQRKDVLSAINSKHIANDILSNYNKSISHRINVIKTKNNKLNIRKSSSEKCQPNDIKHLRLSPDVNGFIIHSDVSDSNDEQQNSIHNGKITMMNMK